MINNLTNLANLKGILSLTTSEICDIKGGNRGRNRGRSGRNFNGNNNNGRGNSGGANSGTALGNGVVVPTPVDEGDPIMP